MQTQFYSEPVSPWIQNMLDVYRPKSKKQNVLGTFFFFCPPLGIIIIIIIKLYLLLFHLKTWILASKRTRLLLLLSLNKNFQSPQQSVCFKPSSAAVNRDSIARRGVQKAKTWTFEPWRMRANAIINEQQEKQQGETRTIASSTLWILKRWESCAVSSKTSYRWWMREEREGRGVRAGLEA